MWGHVTGFEICVDGIMQKFAIEIEGDGRKSKNINVFMDLSVLTYIAQTTLRT